MNIINVTRQTILVERGKTALSFFSRLKGLLFTKAFTCGQGILIKPCSSIHTIGMAYCIDILFIDKEGKVVKTVADLKPYRIASCSGSAYVIEVPTGTVVRTGTQLGDQVLYG